MHKQYSCAFAHFSGVRGCGLHQFLRGALDIKRSAKECVKSACMTICQECYREDNHSKLSVYNSMVTDNVSRTLMQCMFSPLITQSLFIGCPSGGLICFEWWVGRGIYFNFPFMGQDNVMYFFSTLSHRVVWQKLQHEVGAPLIN